MVGVRAGYLSENGCNTCILSRITYQFNLHSTSNIMGLYIILSNIIQSYKATQLSTIPAFRFHHNGDENRERLLGGMER